MKEAKTEEEKHSLKRYMDALRLMEDKLYERNTLLDELEGNKKNLKCLYFDLMKKVL